MAITLHGNIHGFNRHRWIEGDFTAPDSVTNIATVEWYAKNWIDDANQHSTLAEYIEQAILDTGNKSVGPRLKAAIRRLKEKGL